MKPEHVIVWDLDGTLGQFSGLPVRVGNSGSAGRPWRSRVQTLITATVWLVSGATLSLRPFPKVRR